ncbi:gastric cancer antigen Zg14 [Trichinella spiralis]|uniref:gastric cancer antigen Zg14 n=1 Tax=Trichinella spiralis TaxID=6334 RepID=UPI0001EFC574|nr:gastric cancer antigen Zg14 [Trichinella spiralis]
MDEESLKLLFHAFGAVESVNFYSKCNFDKYNDQQKNCSLMWKNQCIIGFKKWKKDYASSFLTKDDYCSAVDLLEKYQERVVNEKKKKKSDLENDEDGWVTVSRGYKNCIKDSKVKQKKKKSCGDLVPFYRFEIRESKRKMIEDLQRKFEEDKKRIAHMQAVRKFKPY